MSRTATQRDFCALYKSLVIFIYSFHKTPYNATKRDFRAFYTTQKLFGNAARRHTIGFYDCENPQIPSQNAVYRHKTIALTQKDGLCLARRFTRGSDYKNLQVSEKDYIIILDQPVRAEENFCIQGLSIE